ncbi:MAG: hypothetical protein Q9220_005491 [cf. Caloplaca sp. 1 TL-2023]
MSEESGGKKLSTSLVGCVIDALQRRLDTSPALQDYEVRLNKFAVQLQELIRQANAQSVNVSRLFYLYSFDVMSDLAFGEPLNMLIDDKNHFAVGFLQDGMDLLGPLSPVPWLVRIGLSIPGVARNFKTLLTWSAQKLEHRMLNEPMRPDVMSRLLEATLESNSTIEDRRWLRGDAFALIVAGSDTVASTLISIFFYIAEDRSHLVKLRAEIKDAVFPYDSGALRQMLHLNGVINEALRLHPALPSGGLRQTPKEGLTIAGRFIPGGVTVSAPRYSLGRRHPVPLVGKLTDIKGRYNCIGKPLALLQVRSIVALLVSEFDVSFAPGEDGVAVWRDLKDQFNSHPGKLQLVFSKRRSGEQTSSKYF